MRGHSLERNKLNVRFFSQTEGLEESITTMLNERITYLKESFEERLNQLYLENQKLNTKISTFHKLSPKGIYIYIYSYIYI